MWWIIGLVIVLILLLVVLRTRAPIGNQELVIAGQNSLRTTLMMFQEPNGDYQDRVWEDRYLLGYMQTLVALTVHFSGVTLTSTEKGAVFVNVLRGLNPVIWREICERVNSLTFSGDPEFMRGADHASNVIGLTMNRLRPEIMADPDVQAALKDAPRAGDFSSAVFGNDGVHGVNPNVSAGGVLHATYMIRHQDFIGE